MDAATDPGPLAARSRATTQKGVHELCDGPADPTVDVGDDPQSAHGALDRVPVHVGAVDDGNRSTGQRASSTMLTVTFPVSTNRRNLLIVARNSTQDASLVARTACRRASGCSRCCERPNSHAPRATPGSAPTTPATLPSSAVVAPGGCVRCPSELTLHRHRIVGQARRAYRQHRHGHGVGRDGRPGGKGTLSR